MPIPKIIIQTHRDPGIGAKEKQTWVKQNPGYNHLFFNDQDCRKFFVANMPEYLATYDKLPLPVQKADLFRYAAVFFYGGIYADVDTICRVPVESYIDMNIDNLVVGIEMTPAIYIGPDKKHTIHEYIHFYCSPTQLLQWIFAAPPKHPALGRMLEKIRFLVSILSAKEIVRCSGNARFTLDLTGPMCFTNVVHDFLSGQRQGCWVTILPQLHWGYNPWVNTDVKLSNPAIKVRHLYNGSWKANPPGRKQEKNMPGNDNQESDKNSNESLNL